MAKKTYYQKNKEYGMKYYGHYGHGDGEEPFSPRKHDLTLDGPAGKRVFVKEVGKLLSMDYRTGIDEARYKKDVNGEEHALIFADGQKRPTYDVLITGDSKKGILADIAKELIKH